jgi:hypothetical protein
MPPGDWTAEAEQNWTQALADAGLAGQANSDAVLKIRANIY